MSALHIVFSPSTFTKLIPLSHTPNNTCFLSPSYSKHLAIKPQKYNFPIVQAQAQSIIQSENAENIVIEEEEEEEEFSDTRFLIQNVPWSWTEDDIRPLLEKYGTVVDIEFWMYNKSRNRGLAFVTMSSHEEALAALNDLQSSEFEGRILNTNWAKPKKTKSIPPPQPKPLPSHNLFVANLGFQARAKDLKDFFNADKGNVVSAEVIFRENPRGSAGYGFVSFNSKAEAEAAIAAFNGKDFMGRPIRVARSRRLLKEVAKENVEPETESAKVA